MAKQITWISEAEAMERLNYKDKKYFRRKVKEGRYDVSYRTNPSGRAYEYDAKAIENLKREVIIA